MTIDSKVTRRALLVAGAGGAGAVVLAACSGGSSEQNSAKTASSPSDADVRPPSASEPESAGAESAGAESEGAESEGAGSEGAGASGATTLAAIDDIDVGMSTSVKLGNGKPAIITRTGDNSVVCFSAICTHEGCTVKPASSTLACPCHGSQFDAKTGKVLGGPAPSPLPKVSVKLEGGNVVAT